MITRRKSPHMIAHPGQADQGARSDQTNGLQRHIHEIRAIKLGAVSSFFPCYGQ